MFKTQTRGSIHLSVIYISSCKSYFNGVSLQTGDHYGRQKGREWFPLLLHASILQYVIAVGMYLLWEWCSGTIHCLYTTPSLHSSAHRLNFMNR